MPLLIALSGLFGLRYARMRSLHSGTFRPADAGQNVRGTKRYVQYRAKKKKEKSVLSFDMMGFMEN